MSLQFYHPNKNNTGSACSFQDTFNQSADYIFATLVKQATWDVNTQNGTFKASLENPDKHIRIKLSETEIGGILDCIDKNIPLQSFHDFNDSAKTIHFLPWFPKSSNENNETQPQKGFSFSISVTNKVANGGSTKESFYIGLTFSEARLIKEYLIFCLQSHFQSRKKSYNSNEKDISKVTAQPQVLEESSNEI